MHTKIWCNLKAVFFFFFRFQIFAIRRQAEASDVEIILGPTQSLECWGKKHLFER